MGRTEVESQDGLPLDTDRSGYLFCEEQEVTTQDGGTMTLSF